MILDELQGKVVNLVGQNRGVGEGIAEGLHECAVQIMFAACDKMLSQKKVDEFQRQDR